MSAELEPLLAAVADPGGAAGWRRCVVTVDGRRVTAAPIRTKSGDAVRVREREGARERTETVPLADWPARFAALAADARRVHVLAADADWHARRSKRGRWLVSRGRPSGARPEEPASHDREKRHPLPADDPEARRLLVATGLFSPEGRLRKPHAAKYRQVQHYLELLRPLPVWRPGRPVRVVDAGCGKAYMSLALCAWGRVNGLSVELTGVDREPRVVEPVERLSAELGYGATFEVSSIWDYARSHAGARVDLLVSLHACDTASDEALAAGVALDAEAIVLAPCCHHELAGQLARDGGWADGLLRHGVVRGRFADLLTDSLRAAALEAFGYRAEVIEFVGSEHTAKNVMIRAVRRPAGRGAAEARRRGLDTYEALAARWQVRPTLRLLLADRWPRG